MDGWRGEWRRYWTDDADIPPTVAVEGDTDEYEGAHLPVDEQQRELCITDGLTEWLVTLGGFIRSILVFLFDLPISISYHQTTIYRSSSNRLMVFVSYILALERFVACRSKCDTVS